MLTTRTVRLLAAATIALPTATSFAQDNELEKCEKPYGTIAVLEVQSVTLQALARYRLQSPTSLIRMFIQQSNCFTVLERGAAMQTLQQERALASSGNLQGGSNMGGGQMVAADFVMTPNVLFSEGNAGGIGGAVASRLGGGLGAVAGGLKFKEAETSMLIADVRSGVQVAAAQGKAKKTDFRLGALGVGGGAAAAVGGYTNTNEGKVVAASYLDNFNAIIKSVKAQPDFKPASARAGASAGAQFAEGDVVVPKIDNINLLADPKDDATVKGKLKKTDELVIVGEEKDGFLKVQGASAEGWVKKTLVSKKS